MVRDELQKHQSMNTSDFFNLFSVLEKKKLAYTFVTRCLTSHVFFSIKYFDRSYSVFVCMCVFDRECKDTQNTSDRIGKK
jgi:hypothetical protein